MNVAAYTHLPDSKVGYPPFVSINMDGPLGVDDEIRIIVRSLQDADGKCGVTAQAPMPKAAALKMFREAVENIEAGMRGLGDEPDTVTIAANLYLNPFEAVLFLCAGHADCGAPARPGRLGGKSYPLVIPRAVWEAAHPK